MKSLEEHNLERLEEFHKPLETKNGIACPKCGEELRDTTPHLVLTSYPPQKNVHCETCGYRGFAFI